MSVAPADHQKLPIFPLTATVGEPGASDTTDPGDLCGRFASQNPFAHMRDTVGTAPTSTPDLNARSFSGIPAQVPADAGKPDPIYFGLDGDIVSPRVAARLALEALNELENVTGRRSRPTQLERGEPPFHDTEPALDPLQRLRNFCSQPLPPVLLPPAIRTSLQNGIGQLLKYTEPATMRISDKSSTASAIITTLLHTANNVLQFAVDKKNRARAAEYQQNKGKTQTKRRELAQAAGERTKDQEFGDKNSELSKLATYANLMLEACMPALIDTLEEAGHADTASYFRESAWLFDTLKTPQGVPVLWMAVGLKPIFRQTLNDLHTPPEVPSPRPPGATVDLNDPRAIDLRLGENVLWMGQSFRALTEFMTGAVRPFNAAIKDRMLEILEMGEETHKLMARLGVPVATATELLEEARGHFDTFSRLGVPDIHKHRKLTSVYEKWSFAVGNAGLALITSYKAWKAHPPRMQPPAASKTAATQAQSTAEPKTAQARAADQEPLAEDIPTLPPLPLPRVKVPRRCINRPSPEPGRSAAAPSKPAPWSVMSPLAAAPHLQSVADRPRAGEPQALAALHRFLHDRNLRSDMASVPADKIDRVLESLAAVVERCTDDHESIYVSDVRNLLDAAWASPDVPARRAFVDSILSNFAARPAADIKAFRRFGLTGGIPKMLRVLHAASDEVALNAARALGFQLKSICRHDLACNPSAEEADHFFPWEFRQALIERRKYYQRDYPRLGQQQDDVVEDMHSSLATALHQLAPYAGAPGIIDLAQNLAELHGSPRLALSGAATPDVLSGHAVQLVTHSANCKLHPENRLVKIDAHNLSAGLLEATLDSLWATTQTQYTSFEVLVGGTHDDGVHSNFKARGAVERWMRTLAPGWQAQYDGKTIYVHLNRPRNGWATYFPAPGRTTFAGRPGNTGTHSGGS